MKYLTFTFLMISLMASAQPNCNYFLYKGDTLQYKACKLVEDIDNQYYQFSREFQEKYDEALKICPYFAYAYQQKSVAYLKSGDFLTWKYLIDKAVEYDPQGNLGYRGWCRYQFFRDYQGAITDIERLSNLMGNNTSIGYGANGDYQLNIAKALCYSALGEKQKAIEIIENELKKETYRVGLFDYYQLGVTYFELKNYKKALAYLEKQNQINQLAETAYYQAQIFKTQNNEPAYEQAKALALKLYKENKKLFDPYTHHFNKVFYTEMAEE